MATKSSELVMYDKLSHIMLYCCHLCSALYMLQCPI